MASNSKYLAQFRSSRQGRFDASMATLQTMPSNYELAAMRFGFDPGHDSTLKNFKEKNIGDLKTFKSSKIAASKEQIELVHGALREVQGVKGELLNLQSLEMHLPSHMR